MALITCPECGTEVSDKAEKCPKCAFPIAAHQQKEEVQVIEKTSKALKGQYLIAVVAIVVGLVLLAGDMTVLGTIVLLFGILWMIVTKVRIWWHHE